MKPSNKGPVISGSLANLSSTVLKKIVENNFDLTLSISGKLKFEKFEIPKKNIKKNIKYLKLFKSKTKHRSTTSIYNS